VCGPFNGRKFYRDLVHELCKLAEKDEPLPYYPQPAWWRALRIADAKDIHRSVRARNAASDESYFPAQYVSRRTVATAGGIDGFSDNFTHRTAAGTTQIAPEIDTCRAPLTLYDRYKRRYAGDKTERERAADAAPTTR
jgi:hypothetical protein